MAEEIGFKLNFDDGGISEKLRKTGELFGKLSNEAGELNKILKSSTNELTNSLSSAVDETTNLQKGLAKTNETAKRFPTKEISDVAIAISKNNTNAKKFNDLIDAANKLRMNGITAGISDLSKEFDELIHNIGLTDDQIKILEDSAGEVQMVLSAIESGEIEQVAEKASVLTKEFASAKSELRYLTNSINSGKLQGDDLEIARQRAAELTDNIGDVRAEIGLMASDTRGLDTIIEGTRLVASGFQIAEGAAALFGDENEDVQKALLKLNAVMAISNGLQEAHQLLLQESNIKLRLASIWQNVYAATVGTSTGAMKIFKIALASTGIGLFIIALGALVANFDAVKAKVLEIFPSLEKIGSVFAGITNGISTFFSEVGNVLTGGVSNIITNVKKLGSDVSKAYSDGFDKNEVQKSNDVIAKGIDQVVASNKKKLEIIEASGKDGSKLQAKILNDELKSLKLAGADKEKILEKEHEINVAAADRAANVAKIRKDAADKEKDRLKQFLDEIKNLENESKSTNRSNKLESIDDSTIEGQRQRLELQKQFDDEDIKQREQTTLKLAKTLDERNKVINAFNAIKKESDRSFYIDIIDLEQKSIEESISKKQKALDKEKDIQAEKDKLQEDEKAKLIDIKKAILDAKIQSIDDQLKYDELELSKKQELEIAKQKLILESLEFQKSALDLDTDDAAIINLNTQIASVKKGIKSLEDEAGKDLRDFKTKFNDLLKKAFGADDEQLKSLSEGFEALKSALLDVVNAGYEAELNSIDASIENRKEKIDELESLIEDEYEKKQDGFANDYDALVQQKAEEEALLKQDNAKRIEIQKEQLRNETAIQAAQQIGSLVTAVANMVASGSKLGIFGLPLIAASIIGLFALFRNYKNQVKQITAQQAYKGGKISEYLEPGVTGKSDRPGHGKGHRIEGTNLYVGADEFIMNAETTAKHLPFLKELNLGSYDHTDLSKMAELMPDTRAYIVETKEIHESYQYSEHIKKAIEDQTKVFEDKLQSLLDADRKRPIITQLPDGSVEKVYYDKSGGKKVEIIRK